MSKAAIALVAGAVLAAAAPAPPHARQVAEGERLAYTLGCVSCHNRDMTGHLVEEDAERLRAWSTNLTLTLPGWRDTDIATALRAGKRPDGSDIWVMPVHTFYWINAAEMRDLIAFLRAQPPAGTAHPAAIFGPRARAAIASGKAKSPAGFLAADLAKAPTPLGPQFAEGRRLALLVCGDCHGPDLNGYPELGAPPALTVGARYALPDFARLLRTGKRPDGTPIGMAPYSADRLFKLSDDEIARIWKYLRASARQAPRLKS